MSYGETLNDEPARLATIWRSSAEALELALPLPDLAGIVSDDATALKRPYTQL